MSQCVTLSLFRFARLRDRAWAFAQMGLARAPLARMPGLQFWKLCGSGVGEGFTPIPNTAIWAILGVWDDESTARRATETAPVFARFHARAQEAWTLRLAVTSARGRWSGRAPFAPSDGPATGPVTGPATGPKTGPVAALTRATLRPRTMLRFWRRTPDISKVIGADPDVIFKIGVGEVPWLHQVTFSIWPDTDAMARFARHGPHAAAIRAVRDEGWFTEELYARFRILGETGSWGGASPLSNWQEAA
ncbi:MAG: spheroidene monooxygenase CrtA [Rhodobacteraceae bacterium HLUCCA08]|nr:MAG: spheroidene monooxygenase CrtA [Rhodobacteraceae bacterium HLUCCA08]